MEKRFHELEGIIAKAKQQVVQHDEEVSDLIHSFVYKIKLLMCTVTKGYWLILKDEYFYDVFQQERKYF